jgi:hypothetical protein
MMQLAPPHGPAGAVVGTVGGATGAEVGGGEVAGLGDEPLPAELLPARPLAVRGEVVTDGEMVVVVAAARPLVGAGLRVVAA